MSRHLPASFTSLARLTSAALATALFTASLHAQANPFAVTTGPYRSVRVSYATTHAAMAGLGNTTVAMELLVVPGTFASRSTITATVSGKAITQRMYTLDTPDTTYEEAVGAPDPTRMTLATRGMLAREYDALDAASRRRLLENLRHLPRNVTSEMGVLPSAIGTRRGTSTVAGQPCEEYDLNGDMVCVMTRAPAVLLRVVAKGQKQVQEASKVVVDGAVGPTELRPTAGRRRELQGCDCTWVERVWGDHHDDPTMPSLREAVRYAVRWLGSTDATRELAEAAGEEP